MCTSQLKASIHELFEGGAMISFCVWAGADQEIFQRGVEEENFERKMFLDTGIKACTHN